MPEDDLKIHGKARELTRRYVNATPEEKKQIEMKEENLSALKDAFYHIFWCVCLGSDLCGQWWQKLNKEHPEPEIQKWLRECDSPR